MLWPINNWKNYYVASKASWMPYCLIAQGEFDAAAQYEHLIQDFPEVASVKADETRHGDMVSALIDWASAPDIVYLGQ